MGINNSTEKVSLDQKMELLQNKIVKVCSIHHQEATVFCSLPSCRKSPYLCSECLIANIHTHEQGLYKHNQFIKSMMNLIQLKKIDDNKIITSSVVVSNRGHANIIKQQVKLMEAADRILQQTQNRINSFKIKLQASIDRTMRKVNRLPKGKTDSYYRFYSNPNIFVNKLMSEDDQQFIMDLKSKLDISASQRKGFSEEQQLQNFKYEFDTIKSNLREILNTANGGYFAKKSNSMNNIQLLDPRAVFKKTISLPEMPYKVFNGAYDILATTRKQVYKVEPFDRTKMLIHNQGVNKLQSQLESGQFIAMLNPNTLLFWNGKKMQKISLLTKISSISIMKIKKQTYGLLGEEEGILNVINLRENKSVFHYRCIDQPITQIEICWQNSTVYCAGQNGNIYMFKFKVQLEEYQFDYFGYLPASLLPLGQLHMMKIHNYDLYLMGPLRNIVLYDLMLGTQIIRTQYNKKTPTFSDVVLYNTSSNPAYKGEQVLITLNENEAVLYCWSFDRGKRSVKVDPILLPNKENKLQQIPIISLAKYKHEIWVAREGLKEIDAFSIEL